jgi:hypothetical protein
MWSWFEGQRRWAAIAAALVILAIVGLSVALGRTGSTSTAASLGSAGPTSGGSSSNGSVAETSPQTGATIDTPILSSSSGTPSASAGSSGISDPSSPDDSSSAGSVTPSGSTDGSDDETPCSTRDLTFARGAYQTHSFHSVDVVTMKNVSLHPCSLEGFSTIAVSQDGNQDLDIKDIDANTSSLWDQVATSKVDISPGDSAGEWVGYVRNISDPCMLHDPLSITVTLPGQSEPSTALPIHFGLCQRDSVFVSPIMASTDLPAGY